MASTQIREASVRTVTSLLDHADGTSHGGSRSDPRHLVEVVRAEQRVSDADTEFEAALRTGVPMLVLAARDRELTLAIAARDALTAVG